MNSVSRARGQNGSLMVPADVSLRVRKFAASRTIHRAMHDLEVSEHTLAALRTCGRLTAKTIARVVARLDEIDAQAVTT